MRRFQITTKSAAEIEAEAKAGKKAAEDARKAADRFYAAERAAIEAAEAKVKAEAERRKTPEEIALEAIRGEIIRIG